MSTPQERYDLAVESVEAISRITRNMADIGIYGVEELKAAAVIVVALTRAMSVLDPVAADEYIQKALKENPQGLEPKSNGMYL